MTARLTRAEIVRRFVAGEGPVSIAMDMRKQYRALVDGVGAVDRALRAALRAAGKTPPRIPMGKGTHYCKCCGFDMKAREERFCVARDGDFCEPRPRTRKKAGKR